MSEMVETIIPGLSIPEAIRLPDTRSDEEMFPHIVNVDIRDKDSRAADSIDMLATMAELICGQDTTGEAAQDALAAFYSDPFVQQLIGMAEKAAA